MQFGKKFKMLMDERNLTAAALEKLIGVPEKTISR
jgi:transcriptional regulator with XRE-family HTH domain